MSKRQRDNWSRVSPRHCRPEAYAYFLRQLEDLDSSAALGRAALAISMHALDDVVPDDFEHRLDDLADEVLRRYQGPSVSARLAHLHEVLFEIHDYCGDMVTYYNPLNSYLPAVLERRRGLPITLTLLYKLVAERVGLEVQGINAPGHFLAAVRDESGELLVDPFMQGVMLTPNEAFDRIEQILDKPVQRDLRLLPPATHAQWLSRMLANLQMVFSLQQRRADLDAMTELKAALALGGS